MSVLTLPNDVEPFLGLAGAVRHIALWSGELPDTRWKWQVDDQLGHPAWVTHGAQGAGSPTPSRMNPQRQRAAVLGLRCQWCDDTIRDGKGWIPLATDHELEPVTVDGRTGRSLVTLEPWLCPACTGKLARVLVAETDDRSIALHRPRHWLTIMATGYPPEHPLAPMAEAAQPCLYVKLALGDGLTMSGADYLDFAARSNGTALAP